MRGGLGIAPVLAAGAAAGPVGLAVAGAVAAVAAILHFFGGGPNAIEQTLNQFRANPSPEYAQSLISQLTAAREHFANQGGGVFSAFQLGPIDRALDELQRYMLAQRAADEVVVVEEPEVIPADEPAPFDPLYQFEPAQTAAPQDPQFYQGAPDDGGLSVTTVVPAVASVVIPAVAPVGSGSPLGPVSAGVLPVGATLFHDAWGWLRPRGRMTYANGVPYCECSTDWWGWIAAGLAVLWATQQKPTYARRRSRAARRGWKSRKGR